MGTKFSQFPAAAALDGTEKLAALQVSSNVLVTVSDVLAKSIPADAAGHPGGVAQLDGSGKVPAAQMPPLAASAVIVQAAATANVNIASPGATIDGYTAVTGDLLLLPAQTTASQNGLWTFNGASSTLTRPPSYASGSVQRAGLLCTIGNGATYAYAIAQLRTDNVTVDTTAATWLVPCALPTTGGTINGQISVTNGGYTRLSLGDDGILRINPNLFGAGALDGPVVNGPNGYVLLGVRQGGGPYLKGSPYVWLGDPAAGRGCVRCSFGDAGFPSMELLPDASQTTQVGLAASRARADQTACIVEWRDENGAKLSGVNASGCYQDAQFTVSTLPAAAAAGAGATAFASNGRKSGEAAGAGTGIPVWCDGANWLTYYDNSIAAA